MWELEELLTLRKAALRHLSRCGKIDDKVDIKRNLFSCDLCDEVRWCEWAYHHDNLGDICVWEEEEE